MILYHTGFLELRNPDIHYGRKNADMGQGFYLTPDAEFARRWAKEQKDRQPVCNIYELDPDGLSIHTFERDAQWYSYLYHNRRGAADTLDADVVIAPIANDTLYDTLGMITSGFLSQEEALQLLSIGPEYTQVALKTEKAAGHLTWLSAQIIEPEEIRLCSSILAQEQEEYLKAIAKAMEEF